MVFLALRLVYKNSRTVVLIDHGFVLADCENLGVEELYNLVYVVIVRCVTVAGR